MNASTIISLFSLQKRRMREVEIQVDVVSDVLDNVLGGSHAEIYPTIVTESTYSNSWQTRTTAKVNETFAKAVRLAAATTP